MKNNSLQPLVSVVMTAYNAAEFVGAAVASILSQTYPKLELIVVNDGSSDKTGYILKNIARKDKRIKLISYAKNRGASYASNLGLSKASGSLIARMDADDIALPDRLTKQVEYLLDNPSVIAVGGQCELIDRNGRATGEKSFPLTHIEIYRALYQYNPIQHPTIMINAKLLGSKRIQYHSDVVLAHDLELLFFLSQYGKLANLEDTVLKYRIHTDSLSLRNPKMTFRDTIAVRKRAVKLFGYKPDMMGRAIDMVQRMIIMILPSVIIYPLFHIIRMRQVGDIKTVLKQSGIYTVNRVQTGIAGVMTAIAAWLVR